MKDPGTRKRSRYLFRLDHFLPFQRTPARDQSPPTLASRMRKLLRRIGPTVLSSPARRIVQAFCFLLFLWMFFHVCWPYHAQPAAAGAIHDGWRVANADQTSGALQLERDAPMPDLAVGQTLFLVDAGAADVAAGFTGRFKVAAAEDARLRVQPDSPLTPDQMDRLLFGAGPWDLHETEPGRWPSHYADDLARKEWVPAETFLVIDPLVSLSTAIAARSWVWSLACAGIILLVCVCSSRADSVATCARWARSSTCSTGPLGNG